MPPSLPFGAVCAAQADAATRLLAPLRHSHGRHAGVPSDNPMYRVPSTPHSLSWDEVGDHFLGEWEVVGHWTDGAAARGGSGGGGVFGGGLSPEETAQLQRKLGGLLRAMWEIEWPIPTAVPEDSRYATLLQISVGQVGGLPPHAPDHSPRSWGGIGTPSENPPQVHTAGRGDGCQHRSGADPTEGTQFVGSRK